MPCYGVSKSGHGLSAETRATLSKVAKEKGFGKWMKGRKLPKEWVENMRRVQVGKTHTIEARRKISEAHKGAKSYLWEGGKTNSNMAVRNSLEYKLWREAVFKRDDFTCQGCLVRGGTLNADHVKPFSLYPELRFAIDNGRTLCLPCHIKTPTFGLNIHLYTTKRRQKPGYVGLNYESKPYNTRFLQRERKCRDYSPHSYV